MNADFERVFDIIDYQVDRYPQSKALNTFKEGQWRAIDINQVRDKANSIAGWFLENEFRKGDMVAFIPKMGSADWMIIDFACQQSGIIVVPIHPTSSKEETEFILHETGAKLCIVCEELLLNDLTDVFGRLGIRSFHIGLSGDRRFPALDASPCSPATLNRVRNRALEVRASDVFAIMYTSGTTGMPKGATLTHENVVSNIKSILPILPLQPGHRVLSFLPFSHIFERTSCYAYIAFGVEIYFSSTRESITSDFISVKPFLCTSVPRTLERMYDFLYEQSVGSNFIKRKLIRWALDVGEQYKSGEGLPLLSGIQLFATRLLVLNIWRRRLGGKLQYIAVGAASLRPEISRLFSASGIRTLVGYGMTEASPFISVNRPGLYRFGTVGVPIPGVNVRIINKSESGDGEIEVTGPNVMSGYFKRPDLNKEVFTADGWFRTGDLGRLEDGRFLMITGRTKDIFKTSAGKYIAPQPLEDYFRGSPFILQCLILGFNRSYVTAVIIPNFSILQKWCMENKIHWTSPVYMIHNIKVIELMHAEVERLNEGLAGFERVRKFILSDEEWTMENKELSGSFKLKRARLLEKYSTEIEKMYEA